MNHARRKKRKRPEVGTRTAEAPLWAAVTVFAEVIGVSEVDVLVDDVLEEGVTMTELVGRTVAARSGCVSIEPEPITII